MIDIIKIMAQIQRMYEERNKLFEESGLEDYVYSDEEIEKYIAEAVEMQVSKKIEQAIKDSGL